MKIRSFMLLLVLFSLPIAAEVHITADDPMSWTTDALTPYIGQTVVFDNPIVVSSNANGDLVVGPWRMYQPQCQGLAGSEAYRTAVRINGSCHFHLTGVSGYHRCGEKIYQLKAKVNSTNSVSWQGGTWSGNKRSDLEASLPDVGDYRLLVCGFNLENYFMTWGSMGADSYAEHQKQRAKVSKALAKINADIFGLVEVQLGNEAVQEIVNDLNSNHPERKYTFFHDASEGTYQKVEYVYDSLKVEPIGKPVEINTEVQNRKKMVGFREKATGEKFIYSINHFKAMNTGGESRRVNESKAVLNSYKSYRLNNNIRENDLLVMGDLNCYAFTDPIAVFTDYGLVDMHRAYHADSSYSYIYGGLTSYIDHALCNETLYPQITGMAAYHINSDEDDRYNYERSSDNTMFRCSDHDPVLVGLKLDSTLVYDPSPQINSANILSGKTDKLVIQHAHSADAQSFYAIYTINGWLVERHEITSAYYEVEMPKTAGIYIVYIYFDGTVYQRKMIVR